MQPVLDSPGFDRSCCPFYGSGRTRQHRRKRPSEGISQRPVRPRKNVTTREFLRLPLFGGYAAEPFVKGFDAGILQKGKGAPARVASFQGDRSCVRVGCPRAVMKTCPHPFCPWSGACSLARSGEGGSLSGVVKDWTSVDVYSWFPVSRRDRAAGGRRQVTPS